MPSPWDLLDTPGFGGYDGSRFGQGTAFADGYAWYRVEVRTPASWAARHVRLAFLAANYRADIWLNGRHLGAHEGGHAPFALPVGDALRPGRPNLLAVRVHRRASYEDYTPEQPRRHRRARDPVEAGRLLAVRRPHPVGMVRGRAADERRQAAALCRRRPARRPRRGREPRRRTVHRPGRARSRSRHGR